MHNVDIRNISLGQIQYFVKVAETNNISKAADFFNLTQPTLSKKLKSMEEQLELHLFIRENNKLILTPAGKYLYDKFKSQIKIIETDIQYAHILQTGYKKSIVIASLDSFDPHEFVLPSLNDFLKNNPDTLFRIETDSVEEVRLMLLQKEADIIFTVLYDFEEKEYDFIEAVELGQTTHMVCMLKNNPLANKKLLSVNDLKQSNFICISPHIIPEYIKMIQKLCSNYGFSPNVTNYVTSAQSLTLNLINSNDIFICDRYYFDSARDEHIRIPLSDTKSSFVIAWNKNNPKPYVRDFAKKVIQKYK